MYIEHLWIRVSYFLLLRFLNPVQWASSTKLNQMNPQSFSTVFKELRHLAFPYFQMLSVNLCHGPHLGQASSWCAVIGRVEPEVTLKSSDSTWEQDLGSPEAWSAASWWNTTQSSASGTHGCAEAHLPPRFASTIIQQPQVSVLTETIFHFEVFCTLLAWHTANSLTFSCFVFLIYQAGITLTSEDCRRLNSLVMAGCSEVYGWQVPRKSKAPLKLKKSLMPSPAVCRGFSDSLKMSS